MHWHAATDCPLSLSFTVSLNLFHTHTRSLSLSLSLSLAGGGHAGGGRSVSFARRRRPAHSPALEALEGSRSGQARVWRGRSSTAAEPEHRRSTAARRRRRPHTLPIPPCRTATCAWSGAAIACAGACFSFGKGARGAGCGLCSSLSRAGWCVLTHLYKHRCTQSCCLSLSLSLSVSLSVSSDPHVPLVFSVFL
jgi:hypothetical protein